MTSSTPLNLPIQMCHGGPWLVRCRLGGEQLLTVVARGRIGTTSATSAGAASARPARAMKRRMPVAFVGDGAETDRKELRRT